MAIKGKAHHRANVMTMMEIADGTWVPAEVELNFTGEVGEPDVVARFAVRQGRPECIELRFLARELGRGLESSDLDVNLDDLILGAFMRFALRPEDPDNFDLVGSLDDREQYQAARELQEARKSRRPVSTEELQRVAAIYTAHVDDKPVIALRDAFGYSQRTAHRRVEQARAAGLLPATTQGKRKA